MSITNVSAAVIDAWPPESDNDEMRTHEAVMNYVTSNLLGEWKRREVHDVDEGERLVIPDVQDAGVITWFSQGCIDTVRRPGVNLFEIPPAAHIGFTVYKTLGQIDRDPVAAFVAMAVQAAVQFDEEAERLRTQLITAVALEDVQMYCESHVFLVRPFKSRMFRNEASDTVDEPTLSLSVQCAVGAAVVWR